jgi:hypothetical protein
MVPQLATLSNAAKVLFQKHFPSPACLPILADLLSILSRFDPSSYINAHSFVPAQHLISLLPQILNKTNSSSSLISKEDRQTLVAVENAVGDFIESYPSTLYDQELRHLRARVLERASDWEGMFRLWEGAVNKGIKPYWNWVSCISSVFFAFPQVVRS